MDSTRNMELLQSLGSVRQYFDSGATLDVPGRIRHLQALKKSMLQHEDAIYDALQKDLGKSKVESYATELGIVLTELNLHINKLSKWMRPQRAGTNLLNLPSSTRIHHDPLGVVLIIAPWNYPLQLTLSPLVGAISGGNCAVLKPSEFTPATEAVIDTIISEAFPKEFVTVVKGDGAQVVPEMLHGFKFDHVFFTGSIPVGKAVYELAAKQLTPVTLELGGKSPTIVHADADIKVAAKRTAIGKWVNAGQTCIAPDYVLVDNKVKTAFIDALKVCLAGFYGDARNSGDYGRIVNAKRHDKLVSYLKDGTVIHGGDHDRDSLYFAPTIMVDVDPASSLMQDEIFGPILPVFGFDDKEAALRLVKQHDHPLAFYVFTNDAATERWWIERVPFGGGCVNNTTYHFLNDRIAFGGIGNSGIGGYHGKHSFLTFTHAKPVMKTPTWIDPKMKYPPFTEKSLKLFKWLIK